MSYISPIHYPHGHRIEQREPEGWTKAFAVFTPNGKCYCTYAFLYDAIEYVEVRENLLQTGDMVLQ